VDNKIGMNNISSNIDGINLTGSSNRNLITSNDLYNNTNYGITLGSSDENRIIDNTMIDNDFGASLNSSSDNNTLYHNNFKNDVYNASDSGSNNQWDNGLEGNWWAGWADNPAVNDTDGDGICEQSYSGTNFNDSKPLFYEDNDRVLVDDPWFWFIQSGVNFAESGWTVYATSSTYLENVAINKTVTVIGEDRNSTIIDARGSESVISIYSTSYVNVSGFTVRNATNGFHLTNSDYNVIANNNISNNTEGIFLHNLSGNDTIIENNIITGNNVGIEARNYASPTIQYNTISYNQYIGILNLYFSNSIIGNNTMINNGVGIRNDIHSNASINNNTISGGNIGIGCGSSSPIITYNNISFNSWGGVSNRAFEAPDIDHGPSNATIHWNNIHNNTEYGLYNDDPTITINATYNWWGNSSGPHDPSPGPPDFNWNPSGDLVSDYITYRLWETAPIEEAGPQ
jgi:parallel beta-helix repeat protein